MKLFKISTWGIVKIYKDIDNYFTFIKTIKDEKANSNSKFNKWNLKNTYFYNIYFTYDMDESEDKLPEHIKKLRLIESLAPLHKYLDEELGYAECLVPEINQFYNENDEPTLTYLIVYKFMFNYISFNGFIRLLIFIGSMMGLYLLFNEWISI